MASAVETQTPDIQTSDFRAILGLRKERASSWSEGISGVTYPLASKIKENLPTVLKEVAINGAVGLAAGGLARIALAGTGVGWIGAAGGGMVAGVAVEAVRELRAQQSLDPTKLGMAGLKGAISGAVGFEVLGLIGQTGWGSAIGSAISEKFSGLGCNFHNLTDDMVESFHYDYCDDPTSGIDLKALTGQSLPKEVITVLPAEIGFEQTPLEIADLPNTLAPIDPNLTTGLNYTERLFLGYDPEFGNSSGVDGLAAAEVTKFLEGMEDWDPFTEDGRWLFIENVETHQDYGYLLEQYKKDVWARNPLEWFEDDGSRVKHFLDGGQHTPNGPKGTLVALNILEGEERNKFFRAALQRRLYIG